METTSAESGQRERQLNAFISLLQDNSLEVTSQSEQEVQYGRTRGPLNGIPIVLKNIVDLTGTHTTCGSEFYEPGRLVSSDPTVTVRLKRARAFIAGKTYLHELASGVNTENLHIGATGKPWDTSCVPGGSCGWSAVTVIVGFCAGAFGTDTVGSVRIPSVMFFYFTD